MYTTKTFTVIYFLLAVAISTKPCSSFIYGGCSPSKFTPGSSYETNLNSLLSSFTPSTQTSRYNNFTVPSPTIYGLFQCRGDLDPTACSSCVSRAVSQVESLCPYAYTGFVQMEECFVRYDNSSFIGVEDKTVMLKKCEPLMKIDDQDALTRVNGVIGSLGSGDGAYRVGGSGDVQGVAQCLGDLSVSLCQDCLADAIGRLRSECVMAQGGYVYLSKCYARFSSGVSHAPNLPNSGGGEKEKNEDDKGVEKTLALIIGIITLVVLLVVFLSFIGKICRKLQDGKYNI